MDNFLRTIIEILEKVLAVYAKAFFGASKSIIEFGEIKIGFVSTRPDTRPYEERIAKLDVARDALAESLAAIDQMKVDAQAAKDEFETTNARLQAILGSSQDAEQKLANIRAAMKQDVDAFQTLAGVPDMKRERWIAFFAGILASTVSAAVVAIALWSWDKVF
ncbi:MAG: hypothetical protein JZU55_13580 [Afipia sp.]|nr:hypothetical protein [Afipia sp.]